MYRNPDTYPVFPESPEFDNKEKDVPSEDNGLINFEEAVEKLQGWERIFSQSIPTNATKDEFVAAIEALDTNFKATADPDNVPGDKLFLKKLNSVNRVLNGLTIEELTLDQVGNLLGGIDFKDEELTLKIRRLFTEHFSTK